MTKTQRELAILGGILAVLVVIMVMRSGGGDGTATDSSTTAAASPQRPATRPGTTPGGAAQQPPLSQYPLELLEPGLSDSAVTAKIRSGGFADPFALDRGRSRPAPTPATTTQPSRPQPPRTWTDRQLSEWPAGVRYQGLIEKEDAPGSYTVRFNNRATDVGETIPGTEWRLIEASPILIRIQRDDARNRIHYYYRYLVPPLE